MKFLFVSNYYDDVPCGGRNLARAHYAAMNEACGGEGTLLSTLSEHHTRHDEPGKISVMCARNKLHKLVNLIGGRIQGFSAEAERIILSEALTGKYSFVWFDDRIYGSAIKALKQKIPNLRLYTFYHTVYFSGKISFRNLGQYWKDKNMIHLEELAARYSDVNVVLNERERRTFGERYSRESLVMPICLQDTAEFSQSEHDGSAFRILFVGGGKHYPNVEGVRWFAHEVMSLLDEQAEFVIVGSYMDRFAGEFLGNPRILVKGRADDLGEYYNNADVVVGPIFSGGGMMTKTAEALMWGKNYLATGHALTGYEGLDEYRCDTAQEFADRINAMIAARPAKYNPEMRKLYEEKYSLAAMTEMFRKILEVK